MITTRLIKEHKKGLKHTKKLEDTIFLKRNSKKNNANNFKIQIFLDFFQDVK